MGLILDMSPRALEKILYFASYVVIDPKETPLLKKQLLNEKEYREAVDKYGEESFVAGMGAEAVQQLLGEIDLESQSKRLKEELKQSTGQKKVRIIRRLEVIESFKNSGNDPKMDDYKCYSCNSTRFKTNGTIRWGRFATSDLNDLYRRVINRNNRLKEAIRFRSS